jgi:hypothetical protein
MHLAGKNYGIVIEIRFRKSWLPKAEPRQNKRMSGFKPMNLHPVIVPENGIRVPEEIFWNWSCFAPRQRPITAPCPFFLRGLRTTMDKNLVLSRGFSIRIWLRLRRALPLW